jgi:hypothetical protein
MGQTLITAGVTLFALVVGALLEPLKTGLTSRSRIRQERVAACRQFIAATKAFYSQMTVVVLPSLTNPDTTNKRVAIDEIRKTIGANIVKISDAEGGVYLYGPDELVVAAEGAIESVGELVVYLHKGSLEDVDLGVVTSKFSEIENYIETFSKLARKHLR